MSPRPDPDPPARRDARLARRISLIGTVILVAGLVAAAVIYLTAADGGGDAYSYEIGGSGVYAISPADSKRYRHDVELYGGKSAILADEFNRWFEGLWQGRRLAFTLAFLAGAGAAACFLVARQLERVEPREG